MMFNKGTPYDLWWTGQEFKGMRVESFVQMLSIDDNVLKEFKNKSFDLVIGHFHDLCPVALAKKVGVDRKFARKIDYYYAVWITHGTSLYDFTAVQMGLRTFPSFVPHPLSACGDHMDFQGRLDNLLWHLSTLDFVNLPENLLSQENQVYKQKFAKKNDPDLWQLSQRVDVLLINGERFLDFPRPLPVGIAFMGEVGKSSWMLLDHCLSK
uniref:glucuronosyltransferase n=1 Tax=Ditylenchus dipsaci TaxID=166011 RepID=A0A915DDW0_9BILA